MGLELTTDRYSWITSQRRYPLRYAASFIGWGISRCPQFSRMQRTVLYKCSSQHALSKEIEHMYK